MAIGTRLSPISHESFREFRSRQGERRSLSGWPSISFRRTSPLRSRSNRGSADIQASGAQDHGLASIVAVPRTSPHSSHHRAPSLPCPAPAPRGRMRQLIRRPMRGQTNKLQYERRLRPVVHLFGKAFDRAVSRGGPLFVVPSAHSLREIVKGAYLC